MWRRAFEYYEYDRSFISNKNGRSNMAWFGINYWNRLIFDVILDSSNHFRISLVGGTLMVYVVP